MKDLTPTKVDRLNILTTIGSIEALSEPLMTINKIYKNDTVDAPLTDHI